MPCAIVNSPGRVARKKDRQERCAVSAGVPGKAGLGLLLVVVASFLMLQQPDAVAHSGSMHRSGMNGGQFHHPNFNNGDFHRGHIRHHGPHGVVVLVPPLSGYSSATSYVYPSVIAMQLAPIPLNVLAPDGTTLSFWYYCVNPAGYYPNVQQCPSGWQVVQANSSY